MKRLLLFFVIAVSCVGLMVVARGGRGGGGHYHGGHGWHGGVFGLFPNFRFNIGPHQVYPRVYDNPYYNDCPSLRSCRVYPDRRICERCYPRLYE